MTMITPSYLGETIEYSSLHACRSTLEDPTLREVKQRHAYLPVIMVTAYGDEERRRKANEYGAAEFVTKPVDFDLLKQHLQQLLPPSLQGETA